MEIDHLIFIYLPSIINIVLLNLDRYQTTVFIINIVRRDTSSCHCINS